MDEAGEESGPKVGGSGNVLGTGGELGVRSEAGRSCLVPRWGRARLAAVCLAGSDMLTAHSGTAVSAAAGSISPSWEELWVGGDGATQKGVRTDASPTRSPPVWGPGSGREASRGGGGWPGAGSGSRRGSWSA